MSIEVIKQLIEDCISMMEYHIEQTRPIHTTTVAIQAAKEALKAIAEAEKQESVACGHCNGSGRMVRDPDIGTDQECFVCDGSGFYADTHPQPKREWVGLTHHEVPEKYRDDSVFVEGWLWAEAKLKEKNHG